MLSIAKRIEKICEFILKFQKKPNDREVGHLGWRMLGGVNLKEAGLWNSISGSLTPGKTALLHHKAPSQSPSLPTGNPSGLTSDQVGTSVEGRTAVSANKHLSWWCHHNDIRGSPVFLRNYSERENIHSVFSIALHVRMKWSAIKWGRLCCSRVLKISAFSYKLNKCMDTHIHSPWSSMKRRPRETFNLYSWLSACTILSKKKKV